MQRNAACNIRVACSASHSGGYRSQPPFPPCNIRATCCRPSAAKASHLTQTLPMCAPPPETCAPCPICVSFLTHALRMRATTCAPSSSSSTKNQSLPAVAGTQHHPREPAHLLPQFWRNLISWQDLRTHTPPLAQPAHLLSHLPDALFSIHTRRLGLPQASGTPTAPADFASFRH
jgi:hypothetical protein